MERDATIGQGATAGQGAQRRRRPTRVQSRSSAGRTIPRLSFPEQLVLWSARRLATIPLIDIATEAEAQACRAEVVGRVSKELAVALHTVAEPDAGTAAAQALEGTLNTFACAGLRGLGLSPLNCRFVSSDERLFLSFLAGCQAGDCRHTSALLSWFFPPAGARIAATHGAVFAARLLQAGFAVPQRLQFGGCNGLSDPTWGSDDRFHRGH
jgi:hypothetical protein